jgi:cytochrome P450
MVTAQPPVALPAIDPLPPVARTGLPWDVELADPVAAIAEARRLHGDTFVVEGPASRTIFLFSPVGVKSFYELPEAEASKGVADWMMLVRKLPDELFDGRRTIMHELFGRDDVHTWGGEVPSSTPRFDRVVAALDELDGSAAFVHPEAMVAVAASGKRAERAAMAEVESLLVDTIRGRDALSADQRPQDLFARIMARWNGESEPARSVGIARDVILVHLGSMSNLFAASGWMIAQMALHPTVLARVSAHEPGLVERCALESTRLGQRSIMLRAVLAPTTVRDERQVYQVAPGAQIATLLPLTNTSALPGLDHYDPDRWTRRRLSDERLLPARELVTTFGHGAHTCPAQPFSLAAMCRSAEQLVERYELVTDFDTVTPLAVQIGGVARSQHPCLVHYQRRP